MRHSILLLSLVSGIMAGAESASVPPSVEDLSTGDRPATSPPAKLAERDDDALTFRPLILVSVGFGSSARVGHGVERRREDGHIVDGTLTVGAKLADHLMALHLGTDANAAEAGEIDAGLSYNHADYRDLVAVHDLTLAAAWSGERHWVIDGDLLLGPLHLAAGREDGVRTFRLGGGVGVRLPKALIRFTCDRLIISTEDDDARALATETALQIGVRPTRHALVQLSAGYTHDALTSTGADGVWESALILGVGF